MSRILKATKPVLLYRGFDCNVFRLPGNVVYKHYAPYKIGIALWGKRNPTTFLLAHKSPYIEQILDYDEEGFVTPLLNKSFGTFVFYDDRFANNIPETIDKIRKYFESENIVHQDIHPENIMYDGIPVIIDWTNTHKNIDDSSAFERWKELSFIRSGKWFINPEPGTIYWIAMKQSIKFVNDTLNFDKEVLKEYILSKVDFYPYCRSELKSILKSETLEYMSASLSDKIISYENLIREENLDLLSIQQ